MARVPLNDFTPKLEGDLDLLAWRINLNAHDKGFYTTPRSYGEAIALIHSELSESLEEDRAGRDGLWFSDPTLNGAPVEDVVVDSETGLVYRADGSSEDPLKPEGRDVELVDAMIRIMDTLQENCASIPELFQMKTAYNETRGFRHGKEY